nr:ribonuclease H-like domain-containing protein [Tanacetum cinerariifolium]
MKRTGRDHDGSVIILPPTTTEEHIVVQRKLKARTTLLQSIPDDHVADFHYLDDARDIWNAVKARIREEKGLHKGYDRMQKILSQLNQLKDKPDAEDINLKFLRALPSSWSQVALTLKTKDGLEFLSFDDLYYKLKTLEVDVKGYNTFSSSQSLGPSHSAFVSATSTSKKMSYRDSLNYSLTTTYYIPSNYKNGSHRSDLEWIEKLDLEKMDLKWQMAMLSVRVHKFEQKARRKIDFDKKESARFNKQKVRCYKCQQRGHFARICRAKGANDKQRYSSFKIKEIRKKEEDSKALITVDTLVDWTNHDSESDGVIAAKEFDMIVGCDSENTIKEGVAKLYNLIAGANSEEANTAGDASEFALMGVISERVLQQNQLTLEDKIRVLSIELERENELGMDDSAFSVFTTNSEDVEGRPIFHRFAKTDSMKAVPLPLTGDYTSLSDYTDLNESQMSYDTKSSTFCDLKCVLNDFVSCNDSDKSSEVNTNDLASSDSSLKSSEHKPTDSSCASTSSVSTSVNEAEIDSNVGAPIKEPISAGHFRKYASSVSKLCFVCGSVPTGKPKVKPVPTGKPKVKPVPTGKPNVKPVPTSKPKVTPVPTGKPTVTPVPTGKPKVKPVPNGKPKVTPVPTGKPQVFTPVPTGRPNRPFLVPTDRGCSPSVISGWWSRTASPMSHLINPTSSYFQPYTPYAPTMYYDMQYGGDIWATAVKPSAGCSWKSHRKGFHWETLFSATEDEGIFDSGCSRSMTGNKERLDDFHAFHGGKVTFGGGKGWITGKGKIRTPILDFENVYYVKELQQFNLGNLACLVTHASFDESVKWHRRMAHVNYKNMNRVSITSPHNKTPYALLTGNITSVSHFKPFGCHVTILNTSDHLGKFDGKADEGYIVGYSVSNKAYRVYNVPNKRVKESMNLWFLEEKPNVQGLGHEWYFDLDYLTDSLGYIHVSANPPACTQGATTHSVGVHTGSAGVPFVQFVFLTGRAQVEANATLSKTLLGDDVSKDNFPAQMAALIKKKRQALPEQLFKERQNQPMTPVQQKAYMRQYIPKVQSLSQIQAFSQTLKRPGPVLEEPSTKRPKSPEAPTPSMPEVPISPVVTSHPSLRTRRKSLGQKHMHKPKSPLPKLDLDAPTQTFLKVVVDKDSNDEDSVDEVWSAVVGWEVLPTPLGEINALYCIDGSTKHFATLCQILHMVDRQDLIKLYGLVVQYYKHHPAGAGLLFWGDLQVLFDSQAGGKGYCIWQNQHPWEIRSWRLYTLSNVYVLEAVSGEVLSMFTDVSYPLSVKLIERMLMHKLEIDSDFMGNDLTTAEQLIQFIKNQLVAAQASLD